MTAPRCRSVRGSTSTRVSAGGTLTAVHQAVRWWLATLLILGSVSVVVIGNPISCHEGDMCGPNVPPDLGILVVGVGAAILVLTVEQR